MMSEWHPLSNDDIELDDREFNLLVTSNDFGNVYATITIQQVIDMYQMVKDAMEEVRDDD